MGKFNEYSQKATPADNDTLMIYDATAKSNKLSPFSGIWNWIVGKLTNAVISNFQTKSVFQTTDVQLLLQQKQLK